MPVAVAQRALGLFFSRRFMLGGHYAAYNGSPDQQKRPTSSDRRTGFDWSLFQVMLCDTARLTAYREDIDATVRGKRVLEIGPGPAAVLTRYALDAGATSVVSIEGDPWVAVQAEKRLSHEKRHAGKWTVIPKMSTDITAKETGGEHFDVLILEVYDSIACLEHVVETMTDLLDRGFTFDSVISRAYETWVAPASAPPALPMSRVERYMAGWGSGSVAKAEQRLRNERSTLHGDFELIDSLRLAEPQLWQTYDLETGGQAITQSQLTFEVQGASRFGGLLIHNRFLFHNGVMDTGRTPSSWGVFFAPLPLGALPSAGPAEFKLHTEVPDAREPSSFVLQAELDGQFSSRHFF